MRAELLVHLVSLTTAVSGALGQNQPEASNVPARLAELVREVRQGEPPHHVPGSVLAAQPETALRELQAYEQDPSDRVRWTVYAHYWSLGVSTDRLDIRQAVTEKLLLATSDSAGGGYTAERLQSFEEEDFGPRVRTLLRQMLAEDPKRTTKDATTYRHLVLVAGIAQLRDEIPHLGTFLYDELAEVGKPGWWGRIGWAARLARARMGVEEDVVRAIQVVEAESDPVVRVARLLRDLAYTRHPAAIAAIGKYLESEERLPQVKDTAPGAQYAQYAMEVLAENVPGFPVAKKGQGAYTLADLAAAKRWAEGFNKDENHP